METFNFNP
ncbi:hypothetical protein F383_37163 [Gossypium arboreum]|uniref:Uncharacterized protein n=1 Tax=Gossypium arboreum TaxID=29729 RepID=A0A0B0N7C5_GOSAR|nr:hypothetical protein F383_37163 [Gossypium arboreum]